MEDSRYVSNSPENRKIGFLGPFGTFTEEAASKIKGELIAFDSIFEILEAVNNKEADFGVVPIENSIEGSVGLTLDLLAHDYDLAINREIVIPISHNILVNEGTGIEDIEVIYSHGQALSQCRKFIQKLAVKTRATSSTAAAAEFIQGRKNTAAIGTKRAAEIYGLKIIAEDIQDYKNNLTRFIVLGQKDHSRTGFDKTSIVFFLYEDRPGGLYEILGEFAKRDLNLTKIESRPSKEKLGSYIFFLDFEGHRSDKKIENVLNMIRSKTHYVKILGSYPIEGDD
ncbi:MAG: prephenate dehydratase [Euryarchaeota archaeon]|nr:prephenate dehydratase [Euryarchaeota archaeon]